MAHAGVFFCRGCDDPHRLCKSFAGDADMLLTALKLAGYQPVKVQ